MNALTLTNPVTQYNVPSQAVETLPDTDRYKCRFNVRSSSSNSIHRISYDAASGAGYWTCSCRGNIRHGSCHHLEDIGLKGRKYGHSKLENSPVFKKLAQKNVLQLESAHV